MIDEKIIRNMKKQMIPSDEAVNDLLNKIAGLQSSPQDITTDVNQGFEEFKFVSVKGTKTGKTFSKKVFYYGTSMVAAVILMIATVSMMGDNPNTPDEIMSQVLQNPQSTVIQGGNDSQGEDNVKPDSQPKSTSEKGEKDDKGNTESKGSKQVKDNKGEKPNQTVSSGDNNPGKGKDSSDNNNTSVNSPTKSWDKEILASTFSNIVISGDNYVVPTVSSKIVTTSQVTTLSLKVQDGKSGSDWEKVDAKVKKIKNVSKEFMVAVDVDGYDGNLIYINNDYLPQNLGQFASDTALSSISTDKEKVMIKGNDGGNSSYRKARIKNLEELISKIILSKKDAPLVSNDLYESGDSFVIFRAKHLMTGLNVNFGVNDKGYVYIKILNKGYTFNIGEENTNNFIDEIYSYVG